jgi:hypothetical protein
LKQRAFFISKILLLIEHFFIEKLIGVKDARLLENENQFSSCDVLLSELSLSCGTGWQFEKRKWLVQPLQLDR